MSESKVNAYLPTFHNAQIEIAQHEARFKVVAAGRRFGKGVLAVCAAFLYASKGGHCRFVSPSYQSDSFHAAWAIATSLADQIPGIETKLQKKEFSFSALGGGWFQFRTAEEPDSLRGEGIDFVAFDEAAHIADLKDTWQKCVRPSLMDHAGDAWFISTPNGFNYFNDLFLKSRDDSTWASFQHPTGDNPYISRDEIEDLRKDMPELVARQEINAEFVQLAGALFKRQNIITLDSPPVGVQWVRSWDLAFTEKTTSDYTAGVKMGMTNDGFIVVDDIVSGQMEWPDAVRLIANTAKLDGPQVRQGIECVSAQVGALQILMRDPMLAAHTFSPIEVHRDKLTRALPLVARSEQGKLAITRGNWNRAFLDELCAFPEGRHDDQVDACSGGLTLISMPTGAITDPGKIKFGTNFMQNKFRPRFEPRRLVTV
jgi:predicted phage terminase large subunit-like protein